MSFAYTIDIQLTDLGFSDVLQTSEPPVRAGSLAASDFQTQTPTKPTTVRQVEPEAPRQPAPTDGMQIVGAVADGGLVVTPGAQSTGHLAGGGRAGDQPHEEAGNEGQEAKNAEESTDDSEDYDESLDENQDVLDDESDGDYSCSVCDLQLSSQLKLQDHMNLHTGQRPHCCAECGKRFCQLNNYRTHLKTHANAKPDLPSADPLRCRICRKAFVSQEALKRHLGKTHFEEEFYECDVCKSVFTDRKDCEQHIAVHMTTQGKFSCDKCGLRFFKQRTLQRHRSRKCQHKFTCTDCDRKFLGKTALLKHSFSHIGMLPYTCLRCSCHFRLPSLYRQHKCEPQRIHCVACLRGFDNKVDFQKHKKDTGCWGHQEAKGDEILCPECGKTFSSKEELRKHGSAHQRILTCDECGKGFHSALLLMSHMGGHASQAPCLCQACGRGFLHQQDYSRHLDRCGLAPLPLKQTKKTPTLPHNPKRPPAPCPPVTKSATRCRSQPRKRRPPKSKPNIPAPTPENREPEGPWRLSLDKPPPQGVNLVLLVPMSTPIAAGLGLAPPDVIPPAEPPVLLDVMPPAEPPASLDVMPPAAPPASLDVMPPVEPPAPFDVMPPAAAPAPLDVMPPTEPPAPSPAALPRVPQIVLTVAHETHTCSYVKPLDFTKGANTLMPAVVIKTEAEPAAVSIMTEADPAAARIKAEADPAVARIMTEAAPAFALIKAEADPAVARIMTEADPVVALIKTEADPAVAGIKTEADPAAARIKTEADPAAAGIKTEADPAAARIKTEADPAAVGIKTEVDPAAASTKTEVDPAAVGIKAPIIGIALQPKYCQVVLRRLSDKELGMMGVLIGRHK